MKHVAHTNPIYYYEQHSHSNTGATVQIRAQQIAVRLQQCAVHSNDERKE